MAELKETLDTLESQYKISADKLIDLISKTTLKPAIKNAQKIFIQESQSGDVSEEVKKMIDEESDEKTKDVFQKIYDIESENPEFKGDKAGNYADTLGEKEKEEFKQYQELRKKLTKEEKEKLKSFSSLSNLLKREKKVLNTKLETTPNYDKVDRLINGLKYEHKIKLLSNIFLNENKEYHPERNSLVHIKIVTARSIQYGDEILEKVALYHDMAKFDTVSFNPKGWPTSQGHDTAGAKLAEDPIVKYICANHMKVKSWVSKGEGSPAPLQPNTKLDVFNGTIDFPNPGQNDDEKAKNFWRLVVFSKMDDMRNSFNPSSLKWDVSFANWDEKCPLKQNYKSSEFKVVTKAEKVSMPFTSQELMNFGAKGPQIGVINKQMIPGMSKEEAFEIIKKELVNPDLTMEKVTNKRWIKTFESFRMSRINEEVMDDLKDDKSIISWLEKNLEEYIDGLHDYGSGYNIIDKLSKLLVIVGLKLGRDKKFLTDYIDDSKFLEDDSKTSYNEYDEGSVEGSISMNGTEIITYKCHSDGYGFGATIDPNRFEKEIIDFIKAMKNPE